MGQRGPRRLQRHRPCGWLRPPQQSIIGPPCRENRRLRHRCHGATVPRNSRIEELVKYCEQIAAGAPSIPFYYYHIPAFNGAFLPMTELLKAVNGRIPNFAGIKYTFESLYEYNQCRLYKNGKYDMLHGDRKSTRLNSSHANISYAVFCLKKNT